MAVSTAAVQQPRTSVIVVGGGLVGLSLALYLQQLKVPFVLIERNNDIVPLPRARGFALRTMEFYRQLGVYKDIEGAAAAAWKMGSFGGVRRGKSMLQSEKVEFPKNKDFLKHMGHGEPSPCKGAACPQPEVEAILKKTLLHRSTGDDTSALRFGHEVLALEQNEKDDGDIKVRIRSVTASATSEEIISGEYLVAADGGRSFIRHELGLKLVELDPGVAYINTFFECDLAALLTEQRTFSQCEVENEEAGYRGTFASMNNTDKWVLHLHRDYDPKKDIASLSDEDLARVIRAAIGDTDGSSQTPPIKILNRSSWHSAVRVATAFRKGRAFLAGDAAHNMPPWGGFNGNSGIADAQNLAWRLAAALDSRKRGVDTEAILDGYERERRPLATLAGTQAGLRTDLHARFGIETAANKAQVDQQIDGGAILMRYQYPSESSTEISWVKTLEAQTGTRFPHAWIDLGDGVKRSTLDLFGKDLVLLTGPEAEVAHRADVSRILKAGKDFTFVEESSAQWSTLTKTTSRGAILVRPDGFVQERIQ